MNVSLHVSLLIYYDEVSCQFLTEHYYPESISRLYVNVTGALFPPSQLFNLHMKRRPTSCLFMSVVFLRVVVVFLLRLFIR